MRPSRIVPIVLCAAFLATGAGVANARPASGPRAPVAVLSVVKTKVGRVAHRVERKVSRAARTARAKTAHAFHVTGRKMRHAARVVDARATAKARALKARMSRALRS